MGMECFYCKCILLNVNVYGPIELKSFLHIFESVYTKWNVGLNGYFVFVYEMHFIVFSLMFRFASINLIGATVARMNLELYQIDVKTDFLNEELDEEI